ARGELVKRGYTAERVLRYGLSHLVPTAVVGITEVSHVEESVRIASSFTPLGEQEKARIRAMGTE
ncbi:MAG: hypothetical protein ACP5U2_05355, partial [Bryobacteraceae bacterium]